MNLKTALYGLVILLMLALAACGNDNGNEPIEEGDDDLNVNAGNNENADADDGNEVAADDGEVYEIRIGHVLGEDYHYTKGAEYFKDLVEERSDGRIEVEVYPGSQLGDEREMMEGMQIGSVEMGVLTTGPLSGFVPEVGLLDLGYLFEDNETAQEVLTGPIGDQINDLMVDVGIRNLGLLDLGFRNVYSDVPVTSLEDLEGMSIRTLETPAHLALFEELGANPTPMGFSELYSALQQGVVDAAENTADAYYDNRHFEVSPEYSETNHVYMSVMYMISEEFYQSLPQDLQDIVTEAVTETVDYHNDLAKEIQDEVYELLEEEGVTIHTIDDLTPFIEAAEPSWYEMAEEIPGGVELLEDLLEQIDNAS